MGSPLSLRNLLANDNLRRTLSGKSWAKKKDCNSLPLVVREIYILHDWKAAVDKKLDKSIVYFQIPHCFLFDKWNGRATMRYKLFSTHKEWLPKRPRLVNGNVSFV